MRRQFAGLWMLPLAVAIGCGDGGGGPAAPDVPEWESDAYPPGWQEVRQPPAGTCMTQNVWAEPSFDWRTSDGIPVVVRVFQPDGQPWPGVVIQVYDDASDLPGDQTLLGKGLTDDAGTYADRLWVPQTVQSLNIVAGIVGANNWAQVPVSPAGVSVEFGRE